MYICPYVQYANHRIQNCLPLTFTALSGAPVWNINQYFLTTCKQHQRTKYVQTYVNTNQGTRWSWIGKDGSGGGGRGKHCFYTNCCGKINYYWCRSCASCSTSFFALSIVLTAFVLNCFWFNRRTVFIFFAELWSFSCLRSEISTPDDWHFISAKLILNLSYFINVIFLYFHTFMNSFRSHLTCSFSYLFLY